MEPTASTTPTYTFSRKPFYDFVKRLADLLLSFLLGTLFLPLMLAVTLLIAIRARGNPFFMQERVGKHGKPIKVLKFRTMRANADDLLNSLSEEELALYREEYKLGDDPRLLGYRKKGDGTKCFGAILRRTSIDELPQLWWNVFLCGNMSMVGPRPILQPEMEQHYGEEERALFTAVKPGLTGYWQAYARNIACYTDGRRQEMELYYISHRSFFLDMKILFRTVAAVILKVGAK